MRRKPKVLQFPCTVFEIPYFSDLRAAVKGRTELCDSYIFAAGYSAACAVVGRRLAMPAFPDYLYPTNYMVLVGASGGARKSTTLSLCEKIVEASDTAVHILNALGTGEGIIRAFAFPAGRGPGGDWLYPDDFQGEAEDFRRGCIAKRAGIDRFIPYQDLEPYLDETTDFEGFRSLAVIDEFKRFLKKTRLEHAASLMPTLFRFHNSPEKDHITVSTEPITCEHPHLCVLTASTLAWLTDNLKIADVQGGLGRRFQFIPDAPVEPIAMPIPIDADKLSRIGARLGALRDRCSQADGPRILKFDEQARTSHTDWYHSNFREKRAATDETQRVIIEGLDQHLRKAALIFAGLLGENSITQQTWQCSYDYIAYLQSGEQAIFAEYTADEMSSKEKRVLDCMEPGKTYNIREMYRRLHVSAKDMRDILGNLMLLGVVKYPVNADNTEDERSIELMPE